MRALIGLGDHKYYRDGMSHLVTKMSEGLRQEPSHHVWMGSLWIGTSVCRAEGLGQLSLMWKNIFINISFLAS